MTTIEAAALIRAGIQEKVQPAQWADLGCGNGIFTNALASCLGANSKIYAIDREEQQIKSSTTVEISFFKLDFTRAEISFSGLDGILMANALHYVQYKAPFMEKIKKLLNANGQIIIVEYDTEKPNQWVPYPISFQNLLKTLSHAGFDQIEKIGERDSLYNAQKMYACAAKHH